MAIEELLSDIGRALRADRPLVPGSFSHRIVVAEPERRFAQIWLRTRGCRHDVLHGGCTICNYWVGSPPCAAEIITAMESAISKLAFQPELVVVSASGSFLDPWEVEPEARKGVLKVLRKNFPEASVILETHPDTVTRQSLEDCSTILGPSWTIEMGLESVTPHVLRCCLHKPTTRRLFTRALDCIQETRSVFSIANVVLGIPFLSSDEILADAVSTIRWAIQHGVDECVLFPMNLRPYTFAYWLAEHGLYSQPNLWVLVDVLAELPEDWLPHINFAWHRIDRGQVSEWDKGIIAPTTCDKCSDELMAGLAEYLSTTDRAKVLNRLKSTTCSCYLAWKNTNRIQMSLGERLLRGYQAAATDILGPEYWELRQGEVVEELKKSIPSGMA